MQLLAVPAVTASSVCTYWALKLIFSAAPALLAELDSRLDQIGLGRIVDGVGRGVVLDRDKNYDKVKRAYDALTDGLGAWYS